MRTLLLLASLIVSAEAFSFDFFSSKKSLGTVTEKKAPRLNLDAEAYEALSYLNSLRFKAGMSHFLYNTTLEHAAKSHASYLTYHDKIGHYESRGEEGFSGEKPSDRVLKAGYPTRLSVENVSSQTIGYKASVDGLFSAIYHRFGFLDFQVDEIGIGVSQNQSHHDKTAYVYNMGIYEISDLCKGVSYTGSGAYTYAICEKEAFRIKKARFDHAYNACYKRNKKVVIYPYANQDDVPPAFFDELPDPLPEYRVSGFPISVQFNPRYYKQVRLKRFELFLGDKKVKNTRIYDHISDINSLFKRNEFALFPLERLAWGAKYRVEVVCEVAGKRWHKTWHFTTQKLPVEPIMIAQDKSTVHISTSRENILYIKPKNPKDILGNIRYDTELDISFIDNNTISITTDADIAKRFVLNLSGREIDLIVEP